jgi:glycosyltransferase involved in cell wall biosynthesis
VLIGGSGAGFAACEEQVRQRGLEDRVFLLGDIDDAEVPALIEPPRLFCLPSTERAEAFGVAMVEGMLPWAKPVVCTRIEGSGVPWLNRHGETGLNRPVMPLPVGGRASPAAGRRARARQLGAAARARYEATSAPSR